MNKSIKLLTFIFNIIIGLIIISYILYRRVWLIRLPKDLYFIKEEYINYNLLILVLFGILLSSYMIYKNILLLFNKKSSDNIITKLFLKISEIIEKSLFEVYKLLGNLLILDVYNKVSFLAQKFYKYFHKVSETLFLFILYGIRLIIISCFLIDVFAFFKLGYFYKACYLLCFSLLIKVLFYILRDFSNNLDIAKSFLIIQHEGVNPETNVPRTSYRLKEEHKHLDLEYHVGQFILCSKVSGYLEMYERYSNFFMPRFNIILYLLYLMGWSFVLLKNIYF